MRYFQLVLMIFVMIALSGCDDVANKKQALFNEFNAADTIKISYVLPDEALELIKNNLENTDFTIIDVRTPQEYVMGHLQGANNIDIYSANFVDRVKKLSRSKTYLLYCLSGSRTERAADIFKSLGFKSVYILRGGISLWAKYRLPILQ